MFWIKQHFSNHGRGYNPDLHSNRIVETFLRCARHPISALCCSPQSIPLCWLSRLHAGVCKHYFPASVLFCRLMRSVTFGITASTLSSRDGFSDLLTDLIDACTSKECF